MADYLQTGITTVKELFQFLADRSTSRDRIKNALLRELRDNMKLLEHRDKSGVNVMAMIDGLSASAIAEAYSANYKFDTLCEGPKKLPAAVILSKQQEKYIGWNVERFMYAIEGKIRDLKNLPKLYSNLETAPVNLSVRLNNLYNQMLLLAIFISRKA